MSFTKSVTLPVPPDEAFALVTEPDRLRRWQAVSATVDLRAGGAWRWTVTPGHIAAGTYREVEPGRRIVMGWGWEGADDLPPDTSTVTVTIEPAADGESIVTLIHEGLDEVQAARHAEGWNHFLERLEQTARGEVGPDPWAYAPENLDAFTAAEAALAALQPVLRGLTVDDQPKPTPCSELDCHGLVEHLFGSMTGLGAMAGATVTNPETGSAENRLSTMADQAITAWRSVDLDGSVPGPGGGTMPASFAAGILPFELLMHGWDLAQGSGQELHVSDEVVGFVRGVAEQLVPGGRGNGAFAEEVQPPADASPLESLAAFTGRTPVKA